MCHSTGNFPYWSFPKGHIEENESTIDAAIREFKEETGFDCRLDNSDTFLYLGQIRQRKDKLVSAYALENNTLDPKKCFSNTIEFPVGSGKIIPEVDKYKWCTLLEAFDCINPSQISLLDKLMELKG